MSDYFSAAAYAYGDHCPTIVMLNNSKVLDFPKDQPYQIRSLSRVTNAYLLEPMEDGLAGVAPSVGLVELMGHDLE